MYLGHSGETPIHSPKLTAGVGHADAPTAAGLRDAAGLRVAVALAEEELDEEALELPL